MMRQMTEVNVVANDQLLVKLFITLDQKQQHNYNKTLQIET